MKKKVAVVTGAGQGLGEAIARRLAAEGAAVAVVDVEGGLADGVAREIQAAGSRAVAVRTDVTDRASVRAMVDEVGRRLGEPDILVNNAGGFPKLRTLLEVEEEEWDAILALNLKSAYLCSRAVLPGMIARRGGRIVSLSSPAARSLTNFSATHYAAAKAGILGFTRHLAYEVGQYGITVNAVAPGTTLTERVRRARTPEDQARIASLVPLGRLGLPEDSAAAVAFLASDDAAYITGITLDVNGGKVMM
ncbi:MAG TPA: SDR family NAD(P)-dependent oxidoreductase [Candidatus Sulfotelmatobacter sp.]|nr:SDR family NAD(P)-dependent oxidoreductase [Candidatus Sulfotelmatobacter sp.]